MESSISVSMNLVPAKRLVNNQCRRHAAVNRSPAYTHYYVIYCNHKYLLLCLCLLCLCLCLCLWMYMRFHSVRNSSLDWSESSPLVRSWIIAERLSARQLILHRISPSVCIACMYVSRLGMQYYCKRVFKMAD